MLKNPYLRPVRKESLFDISYDDPHNFVCKLLDVILKLKPNISPVAISEFIGDNRLIEIEMSSSIVSQQLLKCAQSIDSSVLNQAGLSFYNQRHQQLANFILRDLKMRVIGTLAYVYNNINEEEYETLSESKKVLVGESITTLQEAFRRIAADINDLQAKQTILYGNKRMHLKNTNCCLIQ